MIDRILKTYGEVNTTVKHFPPEKYLYPKAFFSGRSGILKIMRKRRKKYILWILVVVMALCIIPYREGTSFIYRAGRQGTLP